MKQQDFFLKILKILEKLKIPYMISGSVGSMVYGEPRMTNDIDIVLELKDDKIEDFLAFFNEEQFYFPSVEFIKSAIQKKTQFNIIHANSGSKADFIIRKDTEFAQHEFSRKKNVAFTEDFQASTASPEDIIISKIGFYKSGKSEKHISDIVSMLKISDKEINLEYIEDWVEKLNFQEIWTHILTNK